MSLLVKEERQTHTRNDGRGANKRGSGVIRGDCTLGSKGKRILTTFTSS